MKWLKEQGFDVNAKNDSADTPMHSAAKGGHVSAMQWLKEQGADVNAKIRWRTPMYEAACGGNIEAMEWLKENGADVNEKDDQGEILIHALRTSIKGTAWYWLIANGADINANGKSGTPMHCAAWSGHVGVMKWLKEQGADINAKNDGGQTPLQVTRSDDVVEWLKANGAE